MITKYLINLRQFNNGESDTITFPTFDQCMMYGMHKLKEAIKKSTSIVQAILIEDGHGRKIVVSPSREEVTSHNPTLLTAIIKVKLVVDPNDGDLTITL